MKELNHVNAKWFKNLGDMSYIDLEHNTFYISEPEHNLNSIVHEINEMILNPILKKIIPERENGAMKMREEWLPSLIRLADYKFRHNSYFPIEVIHLICPHGKNYTLIERNLKW